MLKTTISRECNLLLQLCSYPFFSPLAEDKAEFIVQALHSLPQPLELLETNALAPLAWRRLKPYLDGELRTGTKILAWRHQRANRVRMQILSQVFAALDANDCCPVLLKGAGLIAQEIYPSIELRPMRDIDILIKADRYQEGAQVLRDFGFEFDDNYRFANYPFYHQLPNARFIVQDITLSLELHIKLSSYDGRKLVKPDLLYQHTVEIYHADSEHSYRVLDAEMQLFHLWRHQLGMSYVPRFIGYVDAVLIAMSVAVDSWPSYQRRWPMMVNYIRMLLQVFNIDKSALPKSSQKTTGFGYGLPTFHEMWQGSPAQKKAFFRPSDWWLRAFYGIPEKRSVIWALCLQHPLNLCRRILYKWRSYFSSFIVKANRF